MLILVTIILWHTIQLRSSLDSPKEVNEKVLKKSSQFLLTGSGINKMKDTRKHTISTQKKINDVNGNFKCLSNST